VSARKAICLWCAGAISVFAQGRPTDWPNLAGDAQRTGWEKSDSRITKDNIKDFQLVLKRKLPGKGKVLTAPVVIGNLISYRGFKELAFVASDAGDMWSIDADLDRMFWEQHLGGSTKGACPGQITAPSLVPPTIFRPRPAGAGAPPRPAGPPSPFGASRPVFTIAADGKLRRLNTSDGSEQESLALLPAGMRGGVTTIADGVFYAVAQSGCGNKAKGLVAAVDISKPGQTPATYPLESAPAGFAIGTDGTVYVQTTGGKLLALSTKELKVKQSFQLADSPAKSVNRVAPVVFAFKGRDLIVSAGADDRLYLLDSDTLGGDDHKGFLNRTEPLAGHVTGGLSSWLDGAGVRWILAPVWGSPVGSVAAYIVEEHDGKPVLSPAWVSGNLTSPEPPVVNGGYVFVVSAGDFQKNLKPKSGTHATLHILDATNGKELYALGSEITAPANLTGVTLVNGRVYFTTTDNTLYAYGVPLIR
jgi:outer membrane protein assembly factor BamB